MFKHQLQAQAPALWAPVLAVLMACSVFAPRMGQAEQIRIGGAGSAMGSVKALAEAFQKIHPEFQFELLPNAGSSGGIKGVVTGVLQIGLITRAPFPEEKAAALQLVEYGRTPLLFISNKPAVKGLKFSEITDIYAGRLSQWPDRSAIRLILRPVKDADTLILAQSSPQMSAALDAAHQRKGLTVAITADEAIEMVAQVKGSLSSSTLAVVARSPASRVHILALDGVEPSLANLINASYPYFKPLYLVYNPDQASALTRQFVAFVRSRKGEKLLAQWGTAPPSTTATTATAASGPKTAQALQVQAR